MPIASRVILLACLFATGCATSIRVETDFDPAQDFSGFRQYGWHDRVSAPDQLVEARIRTVIDSVMAAKGFVRAEAGLVPDFRLSFTAVAEEALRVDSVATSLGYRRRGWGVGVSSTTRVHEYELGTLVIDVIDAAGERLLWRGSSERALAEGRTPEEKTADAREIVAAILQKFPPSP
jgi:hypothetical protein